MITGTAESCAIINRMTLDEAVAEIAEISDKVAAGRRQDALNRGARSYIDPAKPGARGSFCACRGRSTGR
jgi:hypothetical protein